jgi:hypothetical protein
MNAEEKADRQMWAYIKLVGMPIENLAALQELVLAPHMRTKNNYHQTQGGRHIAPIQYVRIIEYKLDRETSTYTVKCKLLIRGIWVPEYQVENSMDQREVYPPGNVLLDLFRTAAGEHAFVDGDEEQIIGVTVE